MILNASAEKPSHSPSELGESCKDFFNCENIGLADQELQNMFTTLDLD